MGIDINKLKNVKKTGPNTIARCPACAEKGQDKKGEHLFIAPDGKFGCVVNPGEEGHEHRKRIFELVGNPEQKCRSFQIHKPVVDATQTTSKDILGRLGRGFNTHGNN